MSTIATQIGDWRRRPNSRRIHLFRSGAPVCGARLGEVGTTKVRSGHGELKDLCYGCLAFGAAGR